jgi:AAA+ ATPase superfamily predicted ATPase
MFIGRQRELSRLDALYNSGRFECAVIYGRRRVGKTTLINEFVNNKKVIYFTGLETDSAGNLENLSQSIFAYRMGANSISPVFTSYKDALESIYEIAKDERIIFVVDEYPYLSASENSISSLLQVFIDTKFLNSKLMLILCGSSMSFMENQVLSNKSPLYGRRTAQFKIEPFDFFDTLNYFSNFSIEDVATIYGITGGVPLYLSFINSKHTVEDNIKQNYLDPTGYLFDEPSNLLKQEVREPARYNAVIIAIAQGSTRVNEIANKVKMETSQLTVFLKNLVSLGIIKKENPVIGKSAKKSLYLIDDGMFRFWYRFIPDNVALIQRGMADVAWKRIEPEINNFMGLCFEEICKQWLWHKNAAGEFPFVFSNVGRWWGNDPNMKEEAEIDIVAIENTSSPEKEDAILGECKWTNKAIDVDVIAKLERRSDLFRFRKKYLYLFSKSGFTDNAQRMACALGVTLISYKEMIYDEKNKQP